MGVRFGITITGKPEGDVDPARQAAEAVELARAARDNGLDAVVVGQHYLTAPYRYLQPVPLLARLIPETGHMDLVTGILLLPLLPPVDVAEQLATIDVMSGGRLTMGVGLGYRDAEFSGFGIERSDRLARQMEALEVVTSLWAGGPVDHDGPFYRVDNVGASIVPLQQPRPPIWVAANAERSITRAHAHGYLPYIGPRPDRDTTASWIAGLRESDPDITVPMRRDLLVFDDAAQLDAAASHLRERYEVYRGWGREADGSGRTTSDDLEDLKKSVLIGRPEEVAEGLVDYERLGASTIVFRVIWPGMDHRESLEMIETVGQRVIPAVRAHGGASETTAAI